MKPLILLLCLILPISALAECGLPNQPYIYVKGMAGDEKPADLVIARFDLVARAPDQLKANADVQGRSSKVFSLFRERKIGDNDIIAEQIRSEADFEQTDTYPRRGKLVGYVVTRRFSIKVRDVNSFPKLVDDLIASANAEFTGIEGLYSKEKE
ncbi:MAG: SIMPL domain-containing protein, partial [Candidatus Udaeobacter sp.]